MLPLQFNYVLAIHYLQDPQCLTPRCDGYGTTLTLQHVLDCKRAKAKEDDFMDALHVHPLLYFGYFRGLKDHICI